MNMSTTKNVFIIQKYRRNVLQNMITYKHLTANALFELIMNDGKRNSHKTETDSIRQGYLFEVLTIILITMKCFNLDYTEICNGQLQNFVPVKNVNILLNENIRLGNNNVDFIVKQQETTIFISIKYKDGFTETDVSGINDTIKEQKITDNYKLSIIVKDKEIYKNHRFINDDNIKKHHYDRIFENGLFYDKTDVICALDVFIERARGCVFPTNIIDFINAEYLLSPRKQLVQRLHQNMTLHKFIISFHKNLYSKWCIAHKPRSGKSITILLICKYLLENCGYKKILIMTSVCSTINSFIDDLNDYIDFTHILYKKQEKKSLEPDIENFTGIIFCSTHYLKMDKTGTKKNFLKNAGFDAIVIDESHHGSSTEKTETGILNIGNANRETETETKDFETDTIINDIRKNIKINIFASGTAEKTRRYYKIHKSCMFEWEMDDEAYMKQLVKTDIIATKTTEIINYMNNKHGYTNIFSTCLNNNTLNKDYTKEPIQVLMKYTINSSLINDIIKYNTEHNTNYGYSFSNLLYLRNFVNNNGTIEYAEDFELAAHNDGLEILRETFEMIISNNRMRNTIMKQIETTQTHYNSRKSTIENPLLIIIYLPIHCIAKLQKTIVKFVKEQNLWNNYNIEYSNATENSGVLNEPFNDFIKTIMTRTKTERKRGCILLLGNKGGLGITYHDCDVTISLDDGHNLDNQKQRFSRALTAAQNKTIGVNVDMNIQRTYLYSLDIIQKYRKNTKTTKSNAEILQYLYEHKIFIFNPQEFNNGNVKITEITAYYTKIGEALINEIDDTLILEQLECDYDYLNKYIKSSFVRDYYRENVNINTELEGEQHECPKGETKKIEISSNTANSETIKENEDTELEHVEIEKLINQTLEMCKGFLFPLLALISRSYNISDFKSIFTDNKTRRLVLLLLLDKKIELNNNNINIVYNIMYSIIDNNTHIVNNIREIYKNAPADKLRGLIEKHFIPSNEEKKKNAEVSTPVSLVDDMLDKIPPVFWKTKQRVFEPCCGKGNFVLGIFDKFYNGLTTLYKDETERCHIIMTECLYYADLTALNVFITTEILKCHIESKCGETPLYDFNKYTGDTLKLDINNLWGIDGFDAVIGNPPYNLTENSRNTLWDLFVDKSIHLLTNNGYLLFVHPSLWRKPVSKKSRMFGLYEKMTKENTILYLEMHNTQDGMKTFKCGTRYDIYLLIKDNKNIDTQIKDENGFIHYINLKQTTRNWLPNSNFDLIDKITNKNDKLNIIYSRSAYGNDKKWTSRLETPDFKYPCILSTPEKGIRYMYSNHTNNGHFNVKKVIFGETSTYNAFYDFDGKYGLTDGAMAFEENDTETANNILKCIKSEKFLKLLKSCSWSNYRIEYNMFLHFNKDFWKEFM